MRGHRDKPSEPDRDESADRLRAQLVEACAAVRRQIERQRTVRGLFGGGGGHGGDDIAIGALQMQLAQLEEALADLGPGDA